MCKPHEPPPNLCGGCARRNREKGEHHWKKSFAGKSSGFRSTSPPLEMNRGTPCGKKRVLCLLFEGIPVGEDECLFGGPREYRAVAVTACQIFRIPAEVFKRRAEASPALALKLFQISARKSQVLGRMLIRDSFLSVRGRVIQFLLSVSEPYGTEEGAGVRLTIRLTHQEVADFLGISRVVVSQCFQSLSREGLLKKTRQHYLLPDRAALEAQLHT